MNPKDIRCKSRFPSKTRFYALYLRQISFPILHWACAHRTLSPRACMRNRCRAFLIIVSLSPTTKRNVNVSERAGRARVSHPRYDDHGGNESSSSSSRPAERRRCAVCLSCSSLQMKKKGTVNHFASAWATPRPSLTEFIYDDHWLQNEGRSTETNALLAHCTPSPSQRRPAPAHAEATSSE